VSSSSSSSRKRMQASMASISETNVLYDFINIYDKILNYIAVPDALEICFVIAQYFLI